MSNSVRPQRRQPTRLPGPWDSPGKNTGVGCHFLLQCMKGKSESEVAQSCPTLSNPMDYSPPGSSVHGIFQARVLEWGAMAFSLSSLTRNQTHMPCIARLILNHWTTREVPKIQISTEWSEALLNLTMLNQYSDSYNCISNGNHSYSVNYSSESFASSPLWSGPASPGSAVLVLACSVTQSCPTLCDPKDCSPPGSSIHSIFPGKNTGVGCHFLR